MKKLPKLDLLKVHAAEYVTPKKPVLLDIAPAMYLAIEGVGAPGGEEFTRRIGGLYGVAFTIKMTRKFAGQQDYGVAKLEAIWWSAGGECNFACLPKDQWCWKLMIRTPEFVGEADRQTALATLAKRGKDPVCREVRLEELVEGRCVQMLHVGPYEREGETVAVMRTFAEGKGFRFNGRHHEIYFSDPRRVPPERLKTLLRQPVVAAEG